MNEVRRRAAQFSLAWADSPGDERQEAHTFVVELLAVYGVTNTRAAVYEARANRSSTGQQGYIDALIPGVAIIEMKSKGKHLPEAERQALDYLDFLPDSEQPRYVLTSDFHNFRLLDLLAGYDDPGRLAKWTLTEFRENADRLNFLQPGGEAKASEADKEAASIKAAQIMGGLFEALDDGGYDPDQASRFLVRLLFCLYADDSGLFEKDLFLGFINERTSVDGSDLGALLTQLWQVLSRPAEKRSKNLDEMLAQFPYVNGDIFDNSPLDIPSFTAKFRERLIEAALFDWSNISPDNVKSTS
jgi:hypothetical protein